MIRLIGMVGGVLWRWKKNVKCSEEFYADRKCIWVGIDVSVWFPVNIGLGQGCVMSPWLFNACIYRWCGAISKGIGCFGKNWNICVRMVATLR